MATKPGHTQVMLRLNSGGVSLETSVTIAAYPPLKVFDVNNIVCCECCSMVASGSRDNSSVVAGLIQSCHISWWTITMDTR